LLQEKVACSMTQIKERHLSPKRHQERRFEKGYADELLRIAEGDLESARALQQSGKGRIENVYFLVQQSIEKCLKAVLVYHEQVVPLVHDLGTLIAKIPDDVITPFGYELSELNQYAAIRRYEEGVWIPDQEDLAKCMKVATDVFHWTKNHVQPKKAGT
jgi:HEPN domain-containing protein